MDKQTDLFFLQFFQDDKLAELAARYRDRAKERREGATTETVPTDESISATAAGYHAVAPDLKSSVKPITGILPLYISKR